MAAERSQKYAILGLLMFGNKHGYEIRQNLSHGLGDALHLGMSQTYALLKGLEGEGDLISRQEIQATRPARKVYSITPEGRERFLSWVSEPVLRIRDLRLEFLVKLYFTRELRLQGLSEFIEKQLNVCQHKLSEIRQKHKVCQSEYERLVLQYRMLQIDAAITWLNSLGKSFGRQGRKRKD
jgi:PadR family transcriptional regulator AphA